MRKTIVVLFLFALILRQTGATQELKSAKIPEIPVFYSGYVLPLPDVSTCNDKASHFLWFIESGPPPVLKAIRIASSNDEVAEVFKKFQTTNNRVLVAGYWRMSESNNFPCYYVNVYYAKPEEEVLKALTGKNTL